MEVGSVGIGGGWCTEVVGGIGIGVGWLVVEFGKWDGIYKHSTKSRVWSQIQPNGLCMATGYKNPHKTALNF